MCCQHVQLNMLASDFIIGMNYTYKFAILIKIKVFFCFCYSARGYSSLNVGMDWALYFIYSASLVEQAMMFLLAGDIEMPNKTKTMAIFDVKTKVAAGKLNRT